MYLHSAGNLYKFFFPITEPISFMDTPIFQNATENKDATIRCEVKGNPEPSVSWYYNGQQIICKYTYLLHFFFAFSNGRKCGFKGIPRHCNGYPCVSL